MVNVGGKPIVLTMLDRVRELAITNHISHIAVSMVSHDADIPAVIGTAGDICLEMKQQKAMLQLTDQLEQSINHWRLPNPDPDLDQSYVVYNTAVGSIGYDFCVFLIDAEMNRIRTNSPAPLKVGFWQGRNPNNDPNHDRQQRWIENVFRPALKLINAVEDDKAVYGTFRECYTTRGIVEAHARGEPVPTFHSPIEINEPPYVTITLREAENWPNRNSNLQVWLKFAHYLKQQGERVIIIRDTAKALEPLDDKSFETDPIASIDVRHRCARYHHAKINFFISNGPATLAVFDTTPWVQFIPVETSGSGYRANTSKFWKEDQGIAVGSQYPWSTPQQRIIWKQPTYNNLVKTYQRLKSVSEVN
jgi:hypothetical protein